MYGGVGGIPRLSGGEDTEFEISGKRNSKIWFIGVCGDLCPGGIQHHHVHL
jgi:hypothetical protein